MKVGAVMPAPADVGFSHNSKG